MSNYLLAFRGTPNAASTAAQEATWANWFRGLGPTIVDTGHRVGAFTTIGSDGQPVQNGGSEPLRGYSWSRPTACRRLSSWPGPAQSFRPEATSRSARRSTDAVLPVSHRR